MICYIFGGLLINNVCDVQMKPWHRISLSQSVCLLKRKLHYFNSLLICCTACCTKKPTTNRSNGVWAKRYILQ